jgi:hypothetical protein
MYKQIFYPLVREYYRWKSRYFQKKIENYNNELKKLPSSASKAKKVCVYGLGYEWFLTSTMGEDYSFQLTDSIDCAQYVFFITKIKDAERITGKKVYLFFREPRDYCEHFLNKVEKDFFVRNEVTIISHLDTYEYFINCKNVKYIRAYAYHHNHHWASERILRKLGGNKRQNEIFSITSGLKGIQGNINRKIFIEQFSATNKNFHFYGRFSKESYSLSNYKGLCAFKWQLLNTYKYNLVLENSPHEDWYISEKIFDALICGCMPIYHGTKKIFEVLPEEWFYYLPSLDSSEVNKLNLFLKTDAYLRVANNQLEIARYINQKFSFYAAVENIVNNVPLNCVIKK